MLSGAEVEEVEAFQAERQFVSRNEAFRQLLRLGLKAAATEGEPESVARKRRPK